MHERSARIDILKGLAIVSVVVLHSVPWVWHSRPLAALTIWQAVPVFLVILGLNATSAARRWPEGSPWYPKEYLARVGRRYLRPLVLVLAASIAGAAAGPLLVPGHRFGWTSVGPGLPTGGRGTFFVWILVEFALLFPVLFAAYRRAPRATFAGCVALDATAELLVHLTPLAAAVPGWAVAWELSLVRFLALVGAGMWLADDPKPGSPRNRVLWVWAGMSAVYLLAATVPGIGAARWLAAGGLHHNLLADGWGIALVLGGMALLPEIAVRPATAAVALVGRASYHIFLVQLLLSGAEGPAFFRYLFRVAHGSAVDLLVVANNVVVSVALGLAFFWADGRLWPRHQGTERTTSSSSR